MRVLVTGSNGQVGKNFEYLASNYKGVDFFFYNSTTLDITDYKQLEHTFDQCKPDYCINLAAYTMVDRAEEEILKAYEINAKAVLLLTKVCNLFDCTLVQISTDFVFDGEKKIPYTVFDKPNPINVYGASKLQGEEYIKSNMNRYYIIRTSWLYSEFGVNFKNTMLRIAKTNKEVNVVDDQIGCPTNVVDLCNFIILLMQEKREYGIYHYCGEKICSWYDFAVLIFKEANIPMKVNRISSADYLSKARRPKYSVLR
ncbi:MAG: dTDP-4-dehydrorhamnose reductase [Flavobacteriaceae bacterium]|jgi:dTDP-4-dehydrorhamnose reductase|nr:dTDP-4-dehydrorhamnose reductase [Flavobacteriaceae bacterium]